MVRELSFSFAKSFVFSFEKVHRFLTRPQLEEFLFADASLTPRSRQVVTWRVLGRLQRSGLVAATPRQCGGAIAGSTLPGYFLTSSGLALASTYYGDLPVRRPARRAPFLLAHSVMAADVELAFRSAARAHAGHEVTIWEVDWQISLKLGNQKVIPDARLLYRIGEQRLRAFVEVDLGTEGTRFISGKIGRYIQLCNHGGWESLFERWPVVLTVTTTESRASSLCEAAAARMAESAFSSRGMVFRFCSLERMREDPLTALWLKAGEKVSSPLVTPAQLTPPVAVDVPHAAASESRVLAHALRLDSAAPAVPSESEKTDGSNLTNQTRDGT